MVQDIILEILMDMFHEFLILLAAIGFFLSLSIKLEFRVAHELVHKFQICIESLIVTVHFEGYRLWHTIKDRSFFINEILVVIRVLKDLEYHSQSFFLKTINDYKAERSIGITLRFVGGFLSSKTRTINTISGYFTIHRKNDQLALIELFLDFFRPLKRLLYPSLSIIGSIFERVTLKTARICKIISTFF